MAALKDIQELISHSTELAKAEVSEEQNLQEFTLKFLLCHIMKILPCEYCLAFLFILISDFRLQIIVKCGLA